MTEEPFKLSPAMIAEIEDKVNNCLDDVKNGMKERLVAAGCYTEWAYVAACELTVGIENHKVNVIDPMTSDDSEDEEETWFNYGDEEDINTTWGIQASYKETPVRVPYINTLEGKHYITEGDWIITGVKGERYPCKADIFELTYEPAENQSVTVEMTVSEKLLWDQFKAESIKPHK